MKGRILVVGIIVLGAGAMVLARPSIRPSKRPSKAVRDPVEPTEARIEECAPAEVPPSKACAVPARSAPQEPKALAEWLLEIPDSDLADLMAKDVLDGHVMRVVGDLTASSASEADSLAAIDGFLARLNRRILAVRRHEGSLHLNF